ncbi:hypothetical protein ACFL5M_02060 [Candidatus Neomarinimicrobiota bacterium]
MSRIPKGILNFVRNFPIILLLACAGREPPPENPSNLPYFSEFPTSVEILSNASIAALRFSSARLEPDIRHSSPENIVTLHQTLNLKELRRLAYRGDPSLRGKAIHADLHVQLSVRPSYVRDDHSRVTVQPVFLVYISRFRDRRQWIQWRSNGTLEAELLENIEAQLHGRNWD